MRRERVLVLVCMAALGLLAACDEGPVGPCDEFQGSGRLVTESRPVSGFDAVSVSAAGQLIVEQTGYESLEITAEDNVLPLIESEVRNGRLLLGPRPGTSLHTTRPVVYRLTVVGLRELDASGASSTEIRRLAGDSLVTQLSGASFLSAAGAVARHELHISGASAARLGDLSSRSARASVSGASYVLLRVSEQLEASASGASTLEYLGDPVVHASVSAGSIVRRVGP
jgi:hypothetical protein